MSILHVYVWEEEGVQIGYLNLNDSFDLFFQVKYWGSMMIKLYIKKTENAHLVFLFWK